MRLQARVWQVQPYSLCLRWIQRLTIFLAGPKEDNTRNDQEEDETQALNALLAGAGPGCALLAGGVAESVPAFALCAVLGAAGAAADTGPVSALLALQAAAATADANTGRPVRAKRPRKSDEKASDATGDPSDNKAPKPKKLKGSKSKVAEAAKAANHESEPDSEARVAGPKQQEKTMIIAMAQQFWPHNRSWYRQLQRVWPKRDAALSALALPTYHALHKWLTRNHQKGGKAAAEAKAMASCFQMFQLPAVEDEELVRLSPAQPSTSVSPPPAASTPVSPPPDSSPEAKRQQQQAGDNADEARVLALLQASSARRASRSIVHEPLINITRAPGRGATIDLSESLDQALKRGGAFFAANNVDELEVFSDGGFGIALCLKKDGKRTGVVMKVMKARTSMRAALRQASSEVGAMYYSGVLAKVRSRTGGDGSPFSLRISPIGGDTGLVFFPDSSQEGSHGHAAIFMEEALGSFQQDAQRLAHYFKDKTGLVHSDAFPHLAQATRSLLVSMQGMGALQIAHGDIKPGNIAKVRAGDAVSGDAMYRDFDGHKCALVLMDLGNSKLPGVAYVPTKLFDHFDPSTGTYKPPEDRGSGSGRASKLLQKAAGTGLTGTDSLTPQIGASDANPNHSGPHTYPLLHLHRLVGCAPSSLPKGEAEPILVAKCDRWGGTPGYIAPEGNKRIGYVHPLYSADCVPGDLWSVAVMLLQISSGDLKNASLHPRDLDDKKLLCEAEDRALWHRYLGKTPMPSGGPNIPDEWQEYLNFIRSMLRMNPEERITPEMALQDPFILSADKYRPESRHGGSKKGATLPSSPLPITLCPSPSSSCPAFPRLSRPPVLHVLTRNLFLARTHTRKVHNKWAGTEKREAEDAA